MLCLHHLPPCLTPVWCFADFNVYTNHLLNSKSCENADSDLEVLRWGLSFYISNSSQVMPMLLDLDRILDS